MTAHDSRPGVLLAAAGAPRWDEPASLDASPTDASPTGARRAVVGVLALALTAGLTGTPALALGSGPSTGSGSSADPGPRDAAELEDSPEDLPEDLPDAPTAATARGAGDGRIEVSWDAGSSTPDGPAVTGYSVTAVRVPEGAPSEAPTTDGDVRLHLGAHARSATLEGLVAGVLHRVEVVALGAAGDSAPAVLRVRASRHVVPTAEAYTLRRPTADGKFPVLADGPAGAFGVHLDPAAGLVDPVVHYTVDGSVPTRTSPVFVRGESAGLTVRQDTTVRWVAVDGGNVAGPEGRRTFDVVESPSTAPVITAVTTAPGSGTVDVRVARLPEPPVDGYRLQAYTGDSADPATGIRVGGLVQVVPPADTTLTELIRRVTGLVNGTPYRFSVAARYGTLWTDESALSASVTPAAASAAVAGADQEVPRGRLFTLDGSASPRAVSYQWTQVRPAPAPGSELPQDPALDLNPHVSGVQATTGAGSRPTLSLRFPLLTAPTSDHDLRFRLTTTHSDGSTRSDLVDVVGHADTVTAEQVRWRTGDLVGGTGSENGATLSLLEGGPTGRLLGTAVVRAGEWTFAVGSAELPGGRLHVWSDHGHTGTVQVTD